MPEVGVPAALNHVPELERNARHLRPQDDRNHDHVLDHEVVHLGEERRPLDWVQLGLSGEEGAIVLFISPAGDVPLLPLVGLRRYRPGGELAHEEPGVGCGHQDRVHLDVAVEVRIRVGIGWIGGEEDGGDDGLDLDLDPGLCARLLDDRLRLLAERVDRGLVDQLELLAGLGAHAVGTALPAGGVEELVGLVDVELPPGVLRGKARRPVEVVGGDDAGASVDMLLDGAAVDEQVQGLAHGGVGQEGVGRLHARALAIDLLPRVGEVALNVLNGAAGHDVDAPPAALLETVEDVVLNLEVPGVVVLPGLQDGAGGGDGVAPALQFERVEERPVGDVVGRVQFGMDRVAGLEVHAAVRPGADRLKVGGRLTGLRAFVGLEEMLGNYGAPAAERVRPERHGLVEADFHGVVVELLHLLDFAVGADARGGGGGIDGILPIEDHVIGGERLAVVPGHALLELPNDRAPILAHAAVANARNLVGQNRHRIAVGIEGGERLVEDAQAVRVRDADGEVRVEEGGRLPPEQAETASAAPLGRREAGALRLALGDSGHGQQLGGHRCGQAQRNHRLHERATGDAARLDLLQQLTDFVFVHRGPSRDSTDRDPSSALRNTTTRVARAGCSGVALMARDRNLSPGRIISHKRWSTKYGQPSEMATAWRPSPQSKCAAGRGAVLLGYADPRTAGVE